MGHFQGDHIYRRGELLLLQDDAVVFERPPFVASERQGVLEPVCREQLYAYHPEVVLYCPQIPQNTGTIARLCAAFSSTLHLVEPMGFTITEKALRRAGLDYWQYVRVFVHQNWQGFLQTRPNRRIVCVETGGTLAPFDFQFLPGDVLVFGAETFGLPPDVLGSQTHQGTAHKITIPMFHSGVRSLNLANTVSIVLYTALAKLHSEKG